MLLLIASGFTSSEGTLFSINQAQAATKIYKVVNPDGTITYTDKPAPGAIEFKFKNKPNVVVPAPVTTNAASTTVPPSDRTFIDNSSIKSQQSTELKNYQLTVTSPVNEETIRNNEGRVTIAGKLAPIGAGTFELYLNGALHQKNTTPNFALSNLDRGEYLIQIRFLDQTGKLLASSPISTFYLQKVSALLRAN